MSFYGFVLLSFAIASAMVIFASVHLYALMLGINQKVVYATEFIRLSIIGAHSNSSEIAKFYGFYFNCMGPACIICDSSKLICVASSSQ